MSIAMLMAMASCSSSDDEVAEIKEESKLVPMTFTATQESNAGTRAALDTGNSVVWQENDKISVFDAVGDGHNQEFTLTGDASSGKFSGNASSTATFFTAVYPYTEGATLGEDGSVSGITLPAEQTATLNSFDPKAALMIAYTTDKTKLEFKNAVSLVKVTTEFACKKIVLTADVDIAGKGKITYNSGAPSISLDQDQSKTITLKPATTGGDIAEGTYYIVVPAITLNGFSISFTASEDYNVYTRTSDQSNKFNRSKIKDFGTFKTTGNGWEWTHTSRGSKVEANQEVDLGLTITKEDGKKYRVIFAKSNLKKEGYLAEKESDFGDYFAFAAIEPWCTNYSRTGTGGSVSVEATAWLNTLSYQQYYWSTVPYRDGTNDYCSEYTDNGDVLDMSDDAANVILGGDWQLPTKDIWENLNDENKYQWDWTTLDDYNGRKVTSITDNTKSIFLPAAGLVYGTWFLNVGSRGFYWSCTASSSMDAYHLLIGDYVIAQSGTNRYYGFSVRPVRLVAE